MANFPRREVSDGTFRRAPRTNNGEPPHGSSKKKTGWRLTSSSSPAVVGNRLYIGALARFNLFTRWGNLLHRYRFTRGYLATRLPDANFLVTPQWRVAGSTSAKAIMRIGNCHLRCLDAKTGEQIWSFETASHVESTPFISQGKLYFTAGADGIYCIDALEGEEIWHFKNVHADMSPVLHNGKLYFGTGYGNYRIYAVDAQTGTEIWSKQMPYPVWGTPSTDDNLVFFGIGRGNFSDSDPIPAGKVVALNPETGDTVWEYKAKDAVFTAIAVQNGYVTFGSRDGSVYCLRATDGKRNWQTGLGAPVVSSPAVTPDTVYAATKNGNVYALSTEDGKVKWEFNTRTVTKRRRALFVTRGCQWICVHRFKQTVHFLLGC